MTTETLHPVELSIVVPMLNESAVIERFFSRLVPVLESVTERYEILCVDDGSSDDTFKRLEAYLARNPRIRMIGLSRNFGKENALSAGLDFAARQAVIPMDADLQDPPEVVPKWWRSGARAMTWCWSSAPAARARVGPSAPPPMPSTG